MTTPIDATDPFVLLVTWGLAWAFGAYYSWRAKKNERPPPKIRRAIPMLAVLIALALRAAYAAIEGQPFTWATVLRAVAAGAGAVLVHSQVREVLKGFGDDDPGDPGTAVVTPGVGVGRPTAVRAPTLPPAPAGEAA